MKKYTIEDLAAGRVATFITDESQIPDLERLLRLAFPKDSFDDYDNYLSGNKDEYYFANQKNNKFWSSFRETNLPKQHVKDFLNDLEEEWEPKPGEICLVNIYGKNLELEFLCKATKLVDDFVNYIFYRPDYDGVNWVKKENIKPLP